MEVGGWGPGLTRNFFLLENRPKIVLIFWSSIPCVFCLYTLLELVEVVGYYDLSMSVMGFQKTEFGWGWVGWVSSINVLFGVTDLFLTFPLTLGIFLHSAKSSTLEHSKHFTFHQPTDKRAFQA